MFVTCVLCGVKEVIKFGLAVMYWPILVLAGSKPHRVILCYHGVDRNRARRFREQMAFLKNGGHKIVRVSQILSAKVEDKDSLVAITFDDGFASVVENAVPVLRAQGLTASIFVPTAFLGQRPKWDMPEDCPDRNELVMDRQHLAELRDSGFEILSHTLSHRALPELSDDELHSELLQSKAALEEILGCEVAGVSYPYGDYDVRVCREARKVGYRFGVTLQPCVVSRGTDTMQLGRFIVSANDNLYKFRLKVCGAYQMGKYLQSIKRAIVRVLRAKSSLCR
jgi:peptidoglycan/xylan/chitin deacetylase (PgdA/CDA1 family)